MVTVSGSYLATVTDVADIGGGLWAVSLRLSTGDPHVIIMPAGTFDIEQIRFAVAAVMQYYRLTLMG